MEKKKIFNKEDKDFQVLMNRLGSNAPGLKLSCARLNAHFSDFFFFFLLQLHLCVYPECIKRQFMIEST